MISLTQGRHINLYRYIYMYMYAYIWAPAQIAKYYWRTRLMLYDFVLNVLVGYFSRHHSTTRTFRHSQHAFAENDQRWRVNGLTLLRPIINVIFIYLCTLSKSTHITLDKRLYLYYIICTGTAGGWQDNIVSSQCLDGATKDVMAAAKIIFLVKI